MTVTYTHEVANARLGGFPRLLLRWRGSVYKLFYKEFGIYIVLYTILSVCYRYIVIPDFREYFEKLCLQFQSYTDLVPISFVLGFYVSMVVGRWWQMYLIIPRPDRLMVIIAANVHGPDYRGRLIRRTLMRYLNLMQVLTYRSISTAVFKRFPTMQHVIDAGFMTSNEHQQYEDLKTKNVKYFVPCVWFANLLSKVRQEGRIYDDMTYQTILKELNDFRGSCSILFGYDWISIPLVYTQVVTVAVYAFFMSTLLSRQNLDVTKGYPGHLVDLYVPIFTIFQFFFYVGWLKVAEQLINPFGEDDDDFEVNFIIDRNIEVSMLTVDNLYLSHPKLERDIYWNDPNPSIPYTAAAANHKVDAFLGSTLDMHLNREEMQFRKPPPSVTIENNDLAVKQNNIGLEKRDFFPSDTLNPMTFRSRFAGRDQDIETKNNRTEREVSAVRDNREEEKAEENQAVCPDSDDDSVDSDVGDGGRSEDDGSDDNSTRTTCFSFLEEEEKEEGEEDKETSRKSSVFQEHSIAEYDLVGNIAAVDARPNVLTTKTTEKRKTNDAQAQNFSEGNLKTFLGKFSLGKAEKFLKQRKNKPKFSKRNDFERQNVREMDEERRNAQARTTGLLKAKKKWSHTLQRNTRGTNPPSNAWTRHKYLSPSRSDLMRMADNASMTSGAEDQIEMEQYSRFGSVASCASSIPSPRPLRFSKFAKGWKQRHSDSISASSRMTSPYASDDDLPYPAFVNALTNRDQHSRDRSVRMPFTEDLRHRLGVVNKTNPPVLSTANSPSLQWSSPSHVGGYRPPSQVPSIGGWENTLENIPEATLSGEVAVKRIESKLNLCADSTSAILAKEKMSSNLKRKGSQDVSASEIADVVNAKINTPHKDPISGVVTPVKEDSFEIGVKENDSESSNVEKLVSNDSQPTFHCEDEVSRRKSNTATCFGGTVTE